MKLKPQSGLEWLCICAMAACAVGVVISAAIAQLPRVNLANDHFVEFDVDAPAADQSPAHIGVIERSELDENGQPTTWSEVWRELLGDATHVKFPTNAPDGVYLYRGYTLSESLVQSEYLEAEIVAAVNGKKPPKMKTVKPVRW